MARTYTITQNGESRNYSIEDGVGPAGSDATVTTAAVRAAVPNIVEVASPSNDDFIQRVGGSWVTRTIAQVRTALGLGTAAYTASTDYATAAQGTLADGALQRSGGTMTGNLAMAEGFNITGALNVAARTADLGTSSTQDGSIILRNAANNNVYAINAASIGGSWIGTMPDKSGTFAMTDDAAMTNERVPTAAGLAAKITGATSKATPVDADEIPIADSAASFGLKKLTWANLKATLKTYFDTLYVALTGNQTIAGNKTFSGQMEATGQAATGDDSVITRLLGDIRYANLPDVIIDGDQRTSDGVSFVWNGTNTGSGSTTQASNFLQVRTGSTTGSTSQFCAAPVSSLIFGKAGSGGLGWLFDSKWIVTFRCDIVSAAADTDGYFTLGQSVSSTSTAQPSTKSCGFRFHNNGVYGFVHDGSTYTESASSIFTPSGTNITDKYTIYNDDTDINFYVNGVLLDSITAPTGATGNGFQGIAFWANNETTTNDMYIRIVSGIKFSNIP